MKISTLFRIALALCAIGSILYSALPTWAATVTLRVPTVQGQTGNTIDVPVEAVAAPGVGAFHLELGYDPKVLTVDSVSRGALAGSNALLDSNPGTAGRLLIGLVTLDAIKGDGPLATVRFKVIGDAGTSSSLTLENSRAWEGGTHAEVLVKAEAGKVTIVGGLPGWLLPLLIALAVMLLLFVIFFLFMRRRRKEPQLVAQPVYAAPDPAVVSPRAARSSAQPRPMDLPEGKPTSYGQAGDAFQKVEDEYFRLKGRLSAGRITHEEFENALKALITQDAQGRYWMIGPDSGKWYVHDGTSWVEGQPR